MASFSERAAMAHLLRRTHFGVMAERVEELASKGLDAALREVIDGAVSPEVTSSPQFKNLYQESAYDDFIALLQFEINRLADPSNDGLGSRMLWFWHNILTSDTKAEPPFLCRQHQLLARNALGNFRTLIREITTDPAMLIYLDGWGSYGENPNQNYARELMELFTLGRGNYTQRDVEAGARALSGWTLEGGNYPPSREGERFFPEQVRSVYYPELGYGQPVTFLSVTRAHNVDSVVEAILEQPACTRYITRRLFQYFVHPSPSAETISSLASLFRNSDYEIKPLLSAMFRHPDFFSPLARGARVRFPLEILLAAARAFRVPVDTFDYGSYFYTTNNMPFSPPNVAGWPLGQRWLSASQTGARARLSLAAFDLPKQNRTIKKIKKSQNPVDETLRQTSLYEVSQQTRTQMERFAAGEPSARNRARGLLALAVTSPEFALS